MVSKRELESLRERYPDLPWAMAGLNTAARGTSDEQVEARSVAGSGASVLPDASASSRAATSFMPALK